MLAWYRWNWAIYCHERSLHEEWPRLRSRLFDYCPIYLQRHSWAARANSAREGRRDFCRQGAYGVGRQQMRFGYVWKLLTQFLFCCSLAGDQRVIATDQGEALANKFKCKFLEASAKTKINVRCSCSRSCSISLLRWNKSSSIWCAKSRTLAQTQIAKSIQTTRLPPRRTRVARYSKCASLVCL